MKSNLSWFIEGPTHFSVSRHVNKSPTLSELILNVFCSNLHSTSKHTPKMCRTWKLFVCKITNCKCKIVLTQRITLIPQKYIEDDNLLEMPHYQKDDDYMQFNKNSDYLPSLVFFLSSFLVIILSPFLPTLCILWVFPSGHLHYSHLTLNIGSLSSAYRSQRLYQVCCSDQLSPLLPCDSFLSHPSFLPCAFLRSSFALLNIFDLNYFQQRNPLTDIP